MRFKPQTAPDTSSPDTTATAARNSGTVRTAVAVSLLLAVVLALYCSMYEGSGWNAAFVAGIAATATALLVFLTQRVLLSTVAVASLTAMIVIAGTVKVELMHMAIHAYDVVYYLTSPATIKFLYTNYTGEMVGLTVAMLLFGAGLVWTHRYDATRVRRHHAAAVLASVAAFTAVAEESKDARAEWRLFEGGLTLTKFVGSWPETLETMWRGQLVEAAPGPSGPNFKIPSTCETSGKPPHVLLIHEESAVPPELLPKLAYDKTMDRMFRSSDGKFHKMRVETYAGASWLTEFGILTGMSTYAYGSMRTFVQAMMAGKVADTLPQSFSRCGYRNAAFYPLDRNFVSNGRFYASTGITEIFDRKDQGTKADSERDSFYFNNLLKFLEGHIASSEKPVFTFLLTMATHQPYHHPFDPTFDAPGGGPGTDAEMHEFLRRLSMARIDLEYLKAELKRRFPNERFLIVHYGDHQPGATWPYLSDADHKAIHSGEWHETQNSPAFVTYYAVEGINYTPPALPDHDVLDAPYLGVVALEAAGLPLSEAYQERKRLMQVCGGRYATCPDRDQILGFHRRLIDSGIVLAR